MDSTEQPMTTIEPNFQSKEFVRFKGKRRLTTNSINRTFKSGENYNFPFPMTDENTVVLPESIELRFKFKSNNNKSWFKNNLARLFDFDLVSNLNPPMRKPFVSLELLHICALNLIRSLLETDRSIRTALEIF